MFARLQQHTNPAWTQPSPPNSRILLCFCTVCSVCSLKLKPSLAMSCVFSLSHCTFCHVVVCALWNVSTDIFGACGGVYPLSWANRTQCWWNAVFAEPITFQRASTPRLPPLTTWWSVCGSLICCCSCSCLMFMPWGGNIWILNCYMTFFWHLLHDLLSLQLNRAALNITKCRQSFKKSAGNTEKRGLKVTQQRDDCLTFCYFSDAAYVHPPDYTSASDEI